MEAMLASSWRSPAAGVRLSSRSQLVGGELDAVGGGVLLDAGDSAGAGDRGDVVAAGQQPGERGLCGGGADLGADGA